MLTNVFRSKSKTKMPARRDTDGVKGLRERSVHFVRNFLDAKDAGDIEAVMAYHRKNRL